MIGWSDSGQQLLLRYRMGADLGLHIGLHRENRVRSIHSSLAIEGNLLSLAQVWLRATPHIPSRAGRAHALLGYASGKRSSAKKASVNGLFTKSQKNLPHLKNQSTPTTSLDKHRRVELASNPTVDSSAFKDQKFRHPHNAGMPKLWLGR